MVLYPNKLPESERVCSGICTVNNEGKTNEATKHVKEPLKRNSQSRLKTEERGSEEKRS